MQDTQYCSSMETTKTRRITSPVVKLIWNYRVVYLMLLPALLFYFIFCYIPMYGVTIAFKDYWVTKGILGSPWVGFINFKQIFADSKFWEVFRNTFEINLLKLVFGFPAPIILALLLNEVRKNYFKRVIQTVLYLLFYQMMG